MSVKLSEGLAHCGLSYSIRTTIAVVLGTVAMLSSAPPASAADADGPAASATSADASSPLVLEEITITGTRIKRRDLESSSPLVTIDSSAIESKSGLNLESYLNQLPNYNPAQTPTTGYFDVQPSAVNTVGVSTISLRGFGPNRSLVLIDGHRTTPVNALMVTDINGIPAAMIDRVEIITGGASAVYGADAIGGVTNFILKKNFQGAQFDVQDGITQDGDGNELQASAMMGTKFSEGKGSIITGMEYYDRNAAYQKNRDFYTRSWTDPNAPQTGSNAFFVQGYSGYASGFADPPSNAALNALFPVRAAGPYGNAPGAGVCASGGCNPFGALYFNPNGSLWTNAGPLNSGSNYAGFTNGTAGYGLVNAYNGLEPNSATTPVPDVVQNLKWNNPLATISEPQTRYSFFANGTYDLTDKIQFYTNARFAESKTTTLLPTPTTGTYGWEAEVPFAAGTDSPILPSAVTSASTPAQLAAIAQAFAANPTSNAYTNPGYIAPGVQGAQHPVPWQLAMVLLSRGAANGVPPTAFLGAGSGGPVTCNPAISAANCSQAATSWILDYLPQNSAPQRATIDTTTVWQMETGFRFPLFADWTGDLYYSRGQSTNYENGLGNDSLQRFRSIIDSPGYGAGANIIGNQNGADLNFGTSVPTTCTSGFYNTLFAGDQKASADCMQAIAAPLQTYTAMQQDIVEANFNGTVFKLPAGDVSAAVGFQYRRDAGQFVPDNLQSTYSFLDQTIGLYPLGTLNNQISTRDGYAELFLPLLSGLKFMDKLNLDIGGRYSSFSNDIPKSTTFKVNIDAAITKSFRIRGGFNRANRAPNLGELYLGEQEYFGGGAAFGDPCSVRSNAPFGAGGAAADFSASGSDPKTTAGQATKLAGGQTTAGANSTYLICQAQMGGAAPTGGGNVGSGAAGYYYGQAGGAFASQGGLAAAAAFAWLNEEGNAALKSETADTWTAGFVFSNLGENPLIAGFSGSVDWWQVHIKNAIELDSPDYANYLCYGTVQVTTAAEAAAQAASPACQNIPRNPTTGGQLTSLLTYTNSATIGTAGVDVQLNWIAQLADMGIHLPGALMFNTQDSFLSYYRTKTSPASFDVNTDWKDSMGPNLAGTNGGAYGYRLFTTIGYTLPAFSVNLRWRFLPSINSYQHAQTQAIIDYDNKVAAAGGTNYLSYFPNTDFAAPAWSQYDLSGTWTVNKWLQVRGGINNVLNTNPPIAPSPFAAAAQANRPNNLNGCSATAAQRGCTAWSTYMLPNDGAGQTAPGFYDIYGRTFWLGFKASF